MSGFDMTTIDPDNLENRLLPGKYQMLVQTHEEDDKKWSVSMEVVASADPNQLGKMHTESLFKSDKAKPRAAKFLVACGLGPDFAAAKARGETNFQPDWNKTHGAGLFCEISKNGDRVQVTYMGFYGLNDPAAKDFPRNDQALAVAKARNDQGNAGITF